jgi:hypothetical protein
MFCEKLGKGMKRPDYKHLCNMLYGMMENQSCHLTKIARALKEKITLKKTVERLSEGLAGFAEGERLRNNYIDTVKTSVDKNILLLVDDSDVTKPCSQALEGLCKVHDGSTGEIRDGYPTLEITALSTKHKMPIPVYSQLYSTKEADFISQPNEVFKGLQYITEHFGRNGVRIMDRGYDGDEYFHYYFEHKEPFVIRCKKNRNVKYKNKVLNIMDLAARYKGKYSMNYTDKKGKVRACKIAIIPIQLPAFPDEALNLVVVYGFGKEPMLLVSNMDYHDNRLALAITKVYLMRWRIEEYYRFKKQQFGFEDFRVRSLHAIRTLQLFVSMLIVLLGLLSEKADDSLFVAQLIDISKRLFGVKNNNKRFKFLYYALADAFFTILQKSIQGFSAFLPSRPPVPSPQLSFF